MSTFPGPNYVPIFAMPLGLQQTPANAPWSSMSGLTVTAIAHLGLGVEFTPTDPRIKTVYAMAGGVAWLYPAGAQLPVTGVEPSTSPGTGSVVLQLWVADIAQARASLPWQTLAPASIIYGNIDAATFGAAMAPHIAKAGIGGLKNLWRSWPQRHLPNEPDPTVDPLTPDKEAALKRFALEALLRGEAGVSVKGGDELTIAMPRDPASSGGVTRLELRFIDSASEDLLPVSHLRWMGQDAWSPWHGHPLIGAVSSFPTPDRWGDYDLRRGDDDTSKTWAGVPRAAENGDQMPPSGKDRLVFQLQADLRTVGIMASKDPVSKFGLTTEWAVRELQIYAGMQSLALEDKGSTQKVYSDRLSQVPNTALYGGSISGVLNAGTRAVLTQWLANRWRCPVVVEAWTMEGREWPQEDRMLEIADDVKAENLWGKDDHKKTESRMFSRDWSGHYALPPGVGTGDRMALGDYRGGVYGGGSSRPPDLTRPDAEFLPMALFGTALEHLGASKLSTYKVVRAVSEAECYGFFDALNAWDSGVMSIGPCQWTLCIYLPEFQRGELGAYLAYLRKVEPAAFQAAIGAFGVRPTVSWGSDGADLFSPFSRKYVTWMERQGDGGTFEAVPESVGETNYFRTWHWFHRFAMAARTIEPFRRRMWDMSWIRLRDIRATPWGTTLSPTVSAIPVSPNSTRPATIGDVFTSERALAMLMRWHVKRPSDVIAGGTAGQRLHDALTQAPGHVPIVAGQAAPVWTGPPTGWADRHEKALIDALSTVASAVGDINFRNTLIPVRDWPTWGAGGGQYHFTLPPTIGKLSEVRGSLNFDATGL